MKSWASADPEGEGPSCDGCELASEASGRVGADGAERTLRYFVVTFQLQVVLGWAGLPGTGRGYLQNLGKRVFER